ncbi:tyrosine-type recombinase/integrase [Piscibacillus sp. B03]|uniref:tyrosine-type recombinase/integrase n=1 Tax=Piscibacillus sp. B03 TaxID=3457430 RepID=UPI003FCC54CB
MGKARKKLLPRGRSIKLGEDLQKEVRRVTKTKKAWSFDETVKDFMRECEMKEYSHHTLKFYEREIGLVRQHLIEVGADLNDLELVTKDNVYEVITLMKRRSLKKMTIHARMRALRAVFNFAVRKNLLAKSPMEDIGLPRIKHQVGATLTKSQLKRLLDAPDLSTFIGLRDYVLMLTFAHTGARVNEVADLTIQAVNFEENAITFTRTKNGNVRRIPMTKQLSKAMQTWFKVRGLDLETEALFITQLDKRMDARQMQKRLKQYARQTRVEEEVSVSPHAFRRTFAKLKIQSGVDVFTVQALMGHSSLDQLRQYVMLYSEDLRKGVEFGIDWD